MGKTLVIKHILSQKEVNGRCRDLAFDTIILSCLLTDKVPYAYINLAECYSSRILYETVLNSLSGIVKYPWLYAFHTL